MAKTPHVMIVEARFYPAIADEMLKGAVDTLTQAGATYEIFSVPGAFEIPAAIQIAIRARSFSTLSKQFDGYVALGCVIRGETTHYDYVCGESARGLMNLSIEHNVAIGYGILTVNDRAQAVRRADPKQLDKGGDAAYACLRMLELKGRFLGGKRS